MLEELTKRRIPKTLAIYVAVAWGIAQILVEIVDRLGAPAWIGSAVIILFIAGFPIAALLAWMYDIEGGKIRRVATLKKGVFASVIAAATVASAGAAIIFYSQVGNEDPEQTVKEAAVAGQISIALFPFDDLSTDTDGPALGVRVADDIIVRLNDVPGMRTKSLLYITALLEQGLGPVEISARLEASHIMRGDLLIDGHRLTLTAQLIDAENGNLLWSQPYDGELSQLLALQDEITVAVAGVLGLTTPAATVSDSRTVVPEAYRLYAQASSLAQEFKAAEALQALTEATRIDPTFAEAFADLAAAYLVAAWGSEDRFGPFADSARLNALEAIEIEPNNKEAQSIVVALDAIQYRWEQAHQGFVALSDASPDAVFEMAAPIVINFGRVNEAIEISRRLHEENPLGSGLMFQTVYYSIAGEFDRALQAADIVQAEGGMFDVSRIPVIHAKNGDVNLAAQQFQIYFSFLGLDPSLADAYAQSVANEEFDPALRIALEEAAAGSAAIDAQQMFFYIYMGLPADSVFELANRLFDDQRLNIIAFYEPYADVYRADPRFVELIERIGLGDYWRNYGPPDFCESQNVEPICG